MSGCVVAVLIVIASVLMLGCFGTTRAQRVLGPATAAGGYVYAFEVGRYYHRGDWVHDTVIVHICHAAGEPPCITVRPDALSASDRAAWSEWVRRAEARGERRRAGAENPPSSAPGSMTPPGNVVPLPPG